MRNTLALWNAFSKDILPLVGKTPDTPEKAVELILHGLHFSMRNFYN